MEKEWAEDKLLKEQKYLVRWKRMAAV